MDISQIIKSPKANITWGKWSDDKIRRTDFPMSGKRGGAFPLTRMWRWGTVCFDALGLSFIVLAAYHKSLPEFQAVLSEKLPKDTRMLARFEYHGNHPVVGWHIHATCGDVSNLQPGIIKWSAP